MIIKSWFDALYRQLELARIELGTTKARIAMLEEDVRYWRTRANSQCHCTEPRRRVAGFDEWTGEWFNSEDREQGRMSSLDTYDNLREHPRNGDASA